MEKTKIYIVGVSSLYSFSYGQTPIAGFFNEIDAEYFKWKKSTPNSGNYYSLSTIDVENVNKENKDFKKFITEKVIQIEKDIKEKQDRKDKDNLKIYELSEEKMYYQSLIK